MKHFKLNIHTESFSEHDIVLNPKEFPDLNIGDVVEVFHPEDEYSRVLLQVKSLREDLFTQKDTISIAKNVAETFSLKKRYKDVCVAKVSEQEVYLDLVELTYKEQYFSRADMWRMKKNLVNSCIYWKKKVEFAEMSTKVDELWSKGEQVTCGYVTSDTRITFRSSTAHVNIFVQMSAEMWEFDNYGDLYFEKAVDGYLVDLFNQWRDNSCNHDVTITMFSRTFYRAETLDEFPMHMRECVQQDYLGRFYEDFYRVVVQNERYEEWANTILLLKKFFNSYRETILKFHERPGLKPPPSSNSTADQGNFLEVLNMALNTYEKFYVDRSFDRTGKLSIVLTPGAGVFEVDRELTHITKQRTIDCGNSSDLVCMGEQPLHAVPLLKFHNKMVSNTLDVGDDYNIPHWINHSFYTSNSQLEWMRQGKFVPRIKMPIIHKNVSEDNGELKQTFREPSEYLVSNDMPFMDYDEYDAQVFKLPAYKTLSRSPLPMNQSKSMSKVVDTRVPRIKFTASISDIIDIPQRNTNKMDYMSTSHGNVERTTAADKFMSLRHVVGSAGCPIGHQSNDSLKHYRPHRALINPFAPSRLHFKVTSNRRRWAHAFPTDMQGASVQHHHHPHRNQSSASELNENTFRENHFSSLTSSIEIRRPGSHKMSDSCESDVFKKYTNLPSSMDSGNSTDSSSKWVEPGSTPTVTFSNDTPNNSASTGTTVAYMEKSAGNSTPGRNRSVSTNFSLYSRSSFGRDILDLPSMEAGHFWLWGVTGEQEWTPEVQTGMDWKSMRRPASLPLTTDYFPDNRSLQLDYVISDYQLAPDEFNRDWVSSLTEEFRPLSTRQVYSEMVSQRIAHGFQIVVLPKTTYPSSSPFPKKSSFMRRNHSKDECEEIILSIGRIFHKITLSGPDITVTRYWPRHPYPQKSQHYTYRFHVPDSVTYDVSWTDFSTEKLEDYMWNYVDQYICTRGEGDFKLRESLKYWRARFLVLPCNNAGTKKIQDGAPRCNIYEERSIAEQKTLVDGFMKFEENIGKIKRPPHHRRKGKDQNLQRRMSVPVSPMPGMPAIIDKGDLAKVRSRTEVVESPPPGTRLDPQLLSPSAGSGLHMKPAESAPYIESKSALEGLSMYSPTVDLIEAMMDENEGLDFLTRQQGIKFFPPQTFLSVEAVDWLIENLSGIETVAQAVGLMQRLQEEQAICHASQNRRHKFVYGFYFYNIPADWKERKVQYEKTGEILPHEINHGFQYEWCEVSIHLSNPDNIDLGPTFLCKQLPVVEPSEDPQDPQYTWSGRSGQLQFAESPSKRSMSSACSEPFVDTHRHASAQSKLTYVNIDQNEKGDREEWGTAVYNGNYSPCAAFEIEVQWLVATGCILGEMVNWWARKAMQCGLHLLAVPCDPFALPFTPNSDPLRGPIFVPLDVDCLKQDGKDLFDEYPVDTREERLVLFQDSILRRFGFMPDKCLTNKLTPSSYPDDGQPSYVHCTGGMFAMIPDNKTTSPRNRDGTHCKLVVGSHKEYIARQRTRTESFDQGLGYFPVGFLWSWNFMLTKRWRSNNTGDEHFQDKMLADFRAFCSNKDDRLREYLEQCRELMSQQDQNRLRLCTINDVDEDLDSSNENFEYDPIIHPEVLPS